MKCRIIVAGCMSPDPARPGREIELPIGHEIEDHDAWHICMPMNGVVRAEPADDECTAKVAEEMALINYIKTGKK